MDDQSIRTPSEPRLPRAAERGFREEGATLLLAIAEPLAREAGVGCVGADRRHQTGRERHARDGLEAGLPAPVAVVVERGVVAHEDVVIAVTAGARRQRCAHPIGGGEIVAQRGGRAPRALVRGIRGVEVGRAEGADSQPGARAEPAAPESSRRRERGLRHAIVGVGPMAVGALVLGARLDGEVADAVGERSGCSARAEAPAPRAERCPAGGGAVVARGDDVHHSAGRIRPVERGARAAEDLDPLHVRERNREVEVGVLGLQIVHANAIHEDEHLGRGRPAHRDVGLRRRAAHDLHAERVVEHVRDGARGESRDLLPSDHLFAAHAGARAPRAHGDLHRVEHRRALLGGCGTRYGREDQCGEDAGDEAG